jgi:ketosteroid isomerase-like protein
VNENGPDIAARLDRLESVEQIRQLVARYGFAVDDRDVGGVIALFAPDGSLGTQGGVSKGRGVEAIGAYFAARFAVLGPTHHFTHDHIIDFDPVDPARATGRVSGHAEVWRDGAPMLTALRYLDTYVWLPDGWRFRSRIQSYMYFVDVRQYPEALGHKLRVRLGATEADWRAGDWPVGLE